MEKHLRKLEDIKEWVEVHCYYDGPVAGVVKLDGSDKLHYAIAVDDWVYSVEELGSYVMNWFDFKIAYEDEDEDKLVKTLNKLEPLRPTY